MIDVFEQQLDVGETLVWTGRSSDRLLIRSDYVFVLAGAFLGVVAIGAFVASLLALVDGDGAASFIGLIVSVFVGTLAVYLMFGRLIRRYRRTRDRSYAITSLRVLEAREGELNSVDLASRPATGLTNHFERRGTITVGSITMENIDGAAVVFELLAAELAKFD